MNVVFNAMPLGRQILFEVARKAVLQILPDEEEVRYRQYVLRDVLANPLLIRQSYDLSIEAHERERGAAFWAYSKSPGSILARSVQCLQNFVVMLKQLKGMGTYNSHRFSSEGFKSCSPCWTAN